MKQVCSICGAIYGQAEPLDDERVTHGYCQECYDSAIAKVSGAGTASAGLPG